MSYDAAGQTLKVGQISLQPAFMADDCGEQSATVDFEPVIKDGNTLLIAALEGTPVSGQ
jgi:hypothetical protein